MTVSHGARADLVTGGYKVMRRLWDEPNRITKGDRCNYPAKAAVFERLRCETKP